MKKIMSASICFCLVALGSRGESLESWLRSLPQVINVSSLEVSNTQCALIHIRIDHSNPLGPDQDITGNAVSFETLLKDTRSDMFAIGTNLQSRLGISSYYVEGYIPDITNILNDRLQSERNEFKDYVKDRERDQEIHREAETNLAILEGMTSSESMASPTNAAELARTIALAKHILALPPMPDHYSQQSVQATSMTLYLAVVANMEPRITEDAAAYRRALSELERRGASPETLWPDSLREIVLHDREIGILKTVAADHTNGAVTNAYALLIMGGMHDFTEAIQNWNATNAFKFSLITVTPMSYQ